MNQHPLQLKQTTIREVVCKAAPTSEFSKTVNLTTAPTFARGKEDPRQWMITLNVTFKAGNGETNALQYTGHIDVSGIVEILPDVPEEKLLKMVALNGPTLLYATARETLAFITSRGPHGAYLLPTMSFSDIQLEDAELATSKDEPEKVKGPAKNRLR